ncbi:MAG TPA: SRPBCC domain-containing protein [Polyangia bacterium]
MSAEKILRKEVVVAAPVSAVWRAWTTVEGVRGFFAPDARIEVRVGGAYEILFDLDKPPGRQGGEGCKVLEVEPERRLVFSWNFPPHMPIRSEFTRGTLEFAATADGKTRVTFTQTGWKEGKAWDEGFAYFERAWEVVLRRLQHRFEAGPVDGKRPPG